MKKMLTFDSFTLIPTYSDIPSRNEVDISTNICGVKSELPVINANMLSICTEDMIAVLSRHKTFSSYHRFFESVNAKKKMIETLIIYKSADLNKFWMSIGVKEEEYDFIGWLVEQGINNLLIDVNHGHSELVRRTIKYIKNNFPKVNIMAGNVSSTDGIKFLNDAGANIIKAGNSFGSACSTRRSTGFGVHPLHVVKTYREETGDWDAQLCADGGFRYVEDIAKALIWCNLVMLGKMFAGTTESNGKILYHDGETFKTYYGNASITTKQTVTDETNHIRYIEGKEVEVPYIGPLSHMLSSIKDGLQSAFSFVGARTLNEYQIKANNQRLYL